MKGEKMKEFSKFFGVATVGERGQIVVPCEARKLLNIKSGDKLIVMSGPPGHSRMIGIARADDFAKFLKHFEEHISGEKEELHKKEK
jgi:AbrB family looped-hinge helix DNA binding protein